MIIRSRLGSILDEALGIGGEHLDGLGNRGANISDVKNQSGQDLSSVDCLQAGLQHGFRPAGFAVL